MVADTRASGGRGPVPLVNDHACGLASSDTKGVCQTDSPSWSVGRPRGARRAGRGQPDSWEEAARLVGASARRRGELGYGHDRVAGEVAITDGTGDYVGAQGTLSGEQAGDDTFRDEIHLLG